MTGTTKKTKSDTAKKASAKSKSPTKRAGAKKKPASDKTTAAAKKPSVAALAADVLLADEEPSRRVAELGAQMLDSRAGRATQAARTLGEVCQRRPELMTSIVDKLVAGISSKQKRVIQTSAEALPLLSRISPARVAKHLPRLNEAFDETNAVGKDGLVRTFAGLCTASVAYQARLEPVLTKALEEADGKTLLSWSQVVLPALKGEPHARAREIVEQRLYRIPRSAAQKIADFLGIRLRASSRG